MSWFKPKIKLKEFTIWYSVSVDVGQVVKVYPDSITFLHFSQEQAIELFDRLNPHAKRTQISWMEQ